MMDIDQLFKTYPENIIGFRVNQTHKIIDFWFNNDWEFPQLGDGSTPTEYAIKKQKENEEINMIYYVIYTETLSFMELYSVLSRIIDYNLDIEKKQKLFAEKLNDLKKLFVNLSYEELKELNFEPPIINQKPIESGVHQEQNK